MKAKLIILPTDKAENALLLLETRGIKNLEYHKDKFFTQEYLKEIGLKSFHLCLADPIIKIKSGDWCICNNKVTITDKNDFFLGKCDSIDNGWIMINGQGENPKFTSKIICSTNKSLIIEEADNSDRHAEIDYKGSSCIDEKFDVVVPQLSEQSIKLLIDYYNKNKKLPDEVEVEEIIDYADNQRGIHTILGIQHNLQGEVGITIPEEKTYTKEEVSKLCTSAWNSGYERGYEASPFEPDEFDSISQEQWCKENNIPMYWDMDDKDHFIKF